mgnify:CR=1 FL=1
MECICGCGRKIRGRAADANLIASEVALELLAWDKARYEHRLGSEAAVLESLIERGAGCYRRLLLVIHGEQEPEHAAGAEPWLRESQEARLGREDMTDRGGFLDITLDFLFYASVPLAFAWLDPARNALAAALLLAAFIGTGSSFLAFALLAERRGLKSVAYPSKGIYYLGGLTEATETLTCFALMCLWPQHFALWATGFAALCGLTLATRIAAGWRMLG